LAANLAARPETGIAFPVSGGKTTAGTIPRLGALNKWSVSIHEGDKMSKLELWQSAWLVTFATSATRQKQQVAFRT
jgi:hypothetical protein